MQDFHKVGSFGGSLTIVIDNCQISCHNANEDLLLPQKGIPATPQNPSGPAPGSSNLILWF